MHYQRKLVFAAACLGMLAFGIVMTVLGTILPSIIARFGLDKAAAGSLFSTLSVGLLAGSVVFGPVVDRYGYKGLLIACIVLILLGLEAMALASSFGVLAVAVFLIGLGGGAINGSTNALVSDISERDRSAGLSLLGVFFGLGAFGVPFALGFLLDVFAYGTLVAFIGAGLVVPLVFYATIAFPAPKQPQGVPPREALRLAREPVLVLMGLMLFLQSGIEITAGGWTTTYFIENLALDAHGAAFVLSTYWAGMIVSRLLLGALLRSFLPAYVLFGCLAVAVGGIVLLLAAPNLWVAVPGVFLLGAGLAAGYPIVLGYAGDAYPHLSGTAFGVLFVMGLTGGSVVPLATGLVADDVGLRASFFFIPAGLVLMALLMLLVLRRLPRGGVRVAPAASTSDVPA